MTNSEGWSVVEGDQRSEAGRRGRGRCARSRPVRDEESLRNVDSDPTGGSATMTFQVELAFQGVVDRPDVLAERLDSPRAGTRLLPFEPGALQLGHSAPNSN